MKAIVVKEFGGPEVLELVERDRLRPLSGQVLVKVEAVGVNPVETYIRAGTYPRLPELPYTPGGNMAGRVIACGANVINWLPGDRVYSAATISGSYADHAVCDADQVFTLPDNLSYAQGAALGVPAATAWRGLFIRGEAAEGQRLLIHGASGSVGQAAVQLAVAAGLQVFGTAGSEDGCALVRSLGAEVVSHNQDGYEQELLGKASGGFDLILEMLANRNLDRDLELLAPRGKVVIIGSRGRIEIDPRGTMAKESDIRGLSLFSATPEEVKETHNGLAAALRSGALKPRIARELPLAEAAEAHRLVMENNNCGKIILVPDEE